MSDVEVSKNESIFLANTEDFVPNKSLVSQIACFFAAIFLVATIIFRTLGMGGAFSAMTPDEVFPAQLIVCILMPYGAYLAKRAKTQAEFVQGCTFIAFPAIFAISLSTAFL